MPGGYYVALPAHAIVAQPATLTGSIGIFGGKFTTGGVYEKLGARVDSVSSGKNAEINSPLRPYNAVERKNKLRKVQPDFSEKKYGYRGFLQFVKAAETQGVVNLEWDDDAEDYIVTAASSG